MTTELDRAFEGWPFMRVPLARFGAESANWTPKIEVFERDKRLVTKVEVTDGHLAISGERKSETEEKKDRFYRCEREYGSFYRSVPLPEGAKLDDIKASFADGVLEVSVPLPAVAEARGVDSLVACLPWVGGDTPRGVERHALQ